MKAKVLRTVHIQTSVMNEKKKNFLRMHKTILTIITNHQDSHNLLFQNKKIEMNYIQCGRTHEIKRCLAYRGKSQNCEGICTKSK